MANRLVNRMVTSTIMTREMTPDRIHAPDLDRTEEVPVTTEVIILLHQVRTIVQEMMAVTMETDARLRGGIVAVAAVAIADIVGITIEETVVTLVRTEVLFKCDL